MKAPDTPANEPERLAALCALEVLDTPAEPRFDRLTRVAQRHFGVQIALVSLVDAERQWFKSRQGLDAAETPRDISFCGHAILSEETLYVSNALEDERFADNPLVVGGPEIRFYAGAPLHAPGGERIGTLCVIDGEPRQLSAIDLGVLRDLADGVEAELERTQLLRDQVELRSNEGRIQQQNRLLDAVSRAQCQFISHKPPAEIFKDLLASILDITASAYGFIGEVLTTEAGEACLKTHGITNIAWDDATRRFYDDNAPDALEFHELDNLVGRVVKHAETVIANAPKHDPRAGGLPPGHPALDSFLGIPFLDDERVVGMVGVANRPGGYDETIAAQLAPLLSACKNIIGSLRMDRRRLQTEADLQSSENRISAIIDTVVDGIVTIDADGIVQTFNPAAERIFGYAAAEVVWPQAAA